MQVDYDPERALLTKVLEEGSLRELVRRRVRPEVLTQEEDREVLRWLFRQHEGRGSVPSLTLLREQFPDWEPEDTDDELTAILDAVQRRRMYGELQVAMQRVANETQVSGPEAGLSALKSMATSMAVEFADGSARDASRCADEVLRQYEIRGKQRGLLGAPWPWGPLNRSTKGIRKGSFTAVYGPTGVMKTWFLLYVAFHVYRRGYRPLFLTCEMMPEDIEQRWAALVARVDYDTFQRGQLKAKSEQRLRRKLRSLQGKDPFPIDELESSGDAALTEISAKAKEYQADVVFLDGLAFLADDLKWSSWDMLLRRLKRQCRMSKIPLVGTHHASKDRVRSSVEKGGDATDVALGDALGRHVDNLIRLSRTAKDREMNEICVTTRKVREGIDSQFFIHALPARSFRFKYSVEDGAGFDA